MNYLESDFLDKLKQVHQKRGSEAAIQHFGERQHTALIQKIEAFSSSFAHLLRHNAALIAEDIHLTQSQTDALQFIVRVLAVPQHSEPIFRTVAPSPTAFVSQKDVLTPMKETAFTEAVVGFKICPAAIETNSFAQSAFRKQTIEPHFVIREDGEFLHISEAVKPLLTRQHSDDPVNVEFTWDIMKDAPKHLTLSHTKQNVTFHFVPQGNILQETVLDENETADESNSTEQSTFVHTETYPFLSAHKSVYKNCGNIRVRGKTYTVYAVNNSWMSSDVNDFDDEP